METETEKETSRVGISTQDSVEATATGNGLALQREKSPVASSNNKKEHDLQKVKNTYKSNENGSSEDDLSVEEEDMDRRTRLRRNDCLRKEFRKLNFSYHEINTMLEALRTERKRRLNEKQFRIYCQENNLDIVSAKQKMLERKQEEVAKYNAEKAERRAAWAQKTVAAGRLNQSNSQKERKKDFGYLFTSPAILSINRESERSRETKVSNKPTDARSLSPKQRSQPCIGRDQSRSRSPLNPLRRENEFEEFRGRLKTKDASESQLRSSPYPMRRDDEFEELSRRLRFSGDTLESQEGDQSYSRSQSYPIRRDDEFEEFRKRMGLSGNRFESQDGGQSHSRSAGYPTRRDAEFEEFRRKEGLCSDRSQAFQADESAERSLTALGQVHSVDKPPPFSHYSREVYNIPIQITDKSDPFGAISIENQALLLNAIKGCVEKENRQTVDISIGISNCEYKKDILNLRCKNHKTVVCLEENVQFFNKLLSGSDISVSRDPIKLSYRRVRAYLLNQKLTSEEIFKIIKKQNDYPTHRWQMFNRTEDGSSLGLVFGVDPASYERIKRDKGYVYFFFNKLLLKLS